MKPAFLLLTRPDPGGYYRVRLAQDLPRAVRGWGATTRLSPVYLDLPSAGPLPTEDFGGANTLLLAGPVHPARVRDGLPAGAAVWLALGAYNVIVYAAGDRAAEFDAWARDLGLRFECWAVRDGDRVAVTYAPPTEDGDRTDGGLPRLVRLASAPRPPALEEAVKEFVPLMASTLARAAAVYAPVVPEMARLVDDIGASVQAVAAEGTPDERTYQTLGLLTQVNAALSRFSSQAFSGTTPVTDTESHYWTHSLLGTGVANIALWRFCSFAFARLGAARIPQRLDALRGRPLDVPGISGHLEDLPDAHPWWDQDHVGQAPLSAADEAAPLATVITCFSGRDGYKSTLQTLSAPLAVIGSCNSLRWTLLTLTHEVSHIVVRGALGVLYPRSTPEAVGRASALLVGEPQNLLEAAQRFLLIAVCATHQIDSNLPSVDMAPQALSPVLRRWEREVEELMVHVFDFLYFYGADPAKYVRGIWLSWSVIPNVANRVSDYVLRTLCAVTANHLRRGTHIETAARDQVRSALQELEDAGQGGQYVREALRHLDEDWPEIRRRLYARRNIVRTVKKFLFSPRIAAAVRGEALVASGGRDGYALRVGEFDDAPVSNPLRFVEEYTTAAQSSVLHSMWMLTVLAFNLQQDPPA